MLISARAAGKAVGRGGKDDEGLFGGLSGGWPAHQPRPSAMSASNVVVVVVVVSGAPAE